MKSQNKEKLLNTLNKQFKSEITVYKNLDIPSLVRQLESLKYLVNNSYDSKNEIFTELIYIQKVKDILQEVHNRICEYFKVKPTTINMIASDFKKLKGSSISGGRYKFASRKIDINVLVNFMEDMPTYYYNHLNSAWSTYHLNCLFHETYHHIQMVMFRKHFVLNEKLPERFDKEIKVLEVYFDNYKEFYDPIFDYFLNPIEIPARKFSIQCLDYFMNNNIIENSFENITFRDYGKLSEISVAGKNLKNFNKSKENWQNYVINQPDKQLYVNDFFNEMNKFYESLEDEYSVIINNYKNNLSKANKSFNINKLYPYEILALNFDYEMYKKSKNKQSFIKKVKKANIEAYIYSPNRLSYLPMFIEEIKQQNNNEMKK